MRQGPGSMRTSNFKLAAVLATTLALVAVSSSVVAISPSRTKVGRAVEKFASSDTGWLQVKRPASPVTPKSKPATLVNWPAGGKAEAQVTHAGSRVGQLPVTLKAGESGSNGRVAVTISDRVAARALGITGVLLQVRRESGRGAIDLSLDYGAFAQAVGGDFGLRLHWVALPSCALTTPRRAQCRVATSIPSQNTEAGHTLSTLLADHGAIPAAGTLTNRAGSTSLIAAVAGASSSNGAFTATSLAPSGSWSASGASGNFSWSYPIAAPSAGAGADVAPSVALSYSSGNVDGRVASTNNQTSWIGQGWDYQPGYIERTYRTCADDTTLPVASQTGDECWAGQIVTMSLGGTTTSLVLDGATHLWHPQADDGSRVELVNDDGGAYSGEYWRVTTTNGVQYYFGLDNLPGGTTNTSATWTTRVYGAHSGDPCYRATGFANSECTQAWRWNLDFAVDPHQNATAYYYTTETTNYYGADNGTTGVPYVRAGYLSKIDYGLREELDGATGAMSISNVPPAGEISFSTAERCVPNSDTGPTCSASQFTTYPAAWPDTPEDQNCTSGASCPNHTPTYWSTRQLTTIKTQMRVAGALQTIDEYNLGQSFYTAGEPQLRLDSITRIAHATTGPDTISLPQIKFFYQSQDNRVNGLNGLPAMQELRLSAIDTESGDDISVFYSQRGRAKPMCTSTSYPTDETNDTMECFPVKWTPPGALDTNGDGIPDPVLDYFHKYVATEIDDASAIGIGTTKQTTYKYLGAPAWHQDDNEVVKPANRTYGQFRGYRQVEVREGDANVAGDVTSLTTTTYYRGMGGQSKDSLLVNAPDREEYADQVREVQSFNGDGGPQVSTKISVLMTEATTATRTRTSTGLPALKANIVGTDNTRTITTLATGSTRYAQTQYAYDSLGRVIAQTDSGTNVDPVCTTTSYADPPSPYTSWIRNRISETIVSAQTCPPTGTSPSPAISDTRMFYDGTCGGNPAALGTLAATGAGDPTETDVATTASHWAKKTACVDTSGRTVSTSIQASPTDNRTTTVSYTPADGGPTTKIVTQLPAVAQNSIVQKATTVLDAGRGIPIETIDVANRKTDASYDAAGRLVAVWQPGHSKNTDPATTTYAYQFGPTQALALTTNTLIDQGKDAGGNPITPTYSTTVAFFDSFGQQWQTQSPADGGGSIVTDYFLTLTAIP